MRIYAKLNIFCFFFAFLFVAATFAAGGELIQPTRTLKSSEKAPGTLSVFSEPPGLDVFLNQSKIGKTPILSMEVTPGAYSLKVKDVETKIHVIPGKSLRLSLFKGSFIQLSEPKKKTVQKPETETTEKKPAESARKQKGYQPQYDPGYWPLKPGGPIK